MWQGHLMGEGKCFIFALFVGSVAVMEQRLKRKSGCKHHACNRFCGSIAHRMRLNEKVNSAEQDNYIGRNIGKLGDDTKPFRHSAGMKNGD